MVLVNMQMHQLSKCIYRWGSTTMWMAVRVDRKDVCKEGSKTPNLGGEGEKRIHDGLRLLNLNDWQRGSPCDNSREVGKGGLLGGKRQRVPL